MEHTPSGGALSGTATGAAGGPLTIGGVLDVLREEFPETGVSTIRFLEAEGLVEPRRSPSGSRLFTPRDIERLSHVLRMQRDHCLPLREIRQQLDAGGRDRDWRDRQPPQSAAASPVPMEPHEQYGQPEAGPASVPGAGLPAASASAAPPATARVGRVELLAAAGAREDQLAEWESYGLLSAGEDGCFDIGGVTVARLVTDLGRSGLEPRHLRSVRAAAEREADLLGQVVAPLRRHQNPRARADAETKARELADLSGQLHAALVRIALRRSAG